MEQVLWESLSEQQQCSLGCCKEAVPVPTTLPSWEIREQRALRRKAKEEAMDAKINLCVNTPSTRPARDPVEEQRGYLFGRLYNISQLKKETARKAFGLTDDRPPKTWTELQERIASGMFVFDKAGEENDAWPCSSFEHITWRDPAVKKDRPGYETWKYKLDLAEIDVQDVIKIGTPAEALTALKQFEAATI